MKKQESQTQAACPLCGSLRSTIRVSESRLLRMPAGTVIRTCGDCGLSVREPLATGSAGLEEYGADYYYDHQMLERDAPPSLVRALPLLEGPRGPGRLLEIGCGLGAFLVRARDRGWKVHGIEVSPWAAAEARRRTRSPILLARAEALPYPAAIFDTVVSHHVFEHLADPFEALRESWRVCRRGGRLLLILPNELGHLFVRWALCAQHGQPLGEGPVANLRRWLAYQTPQPPRDSSHLYFFSPQALRLAAQRTGWRPLRLQTFRVRRDVKRSYLLGHFVKAGLYAAEAWLRRGPEMILLAEAVEPAATYAPAARL